MATNSSQAGWLLTKLGEHARQGMAKLHPVSEKQLAAVRAAVGAQWQQEQAGKVRGKTRGKPPKVARKQASQGKTASKRKSRNYGHSH